VAAAAARAVAAVTLRAGAGGGEAAAGGKALTVASMLERDRKWAAKMGREFDAKVRPIGRARRRGGAPAFSLARIHRFASRRRRRRRRHASAPPALLFSARRQAEERLKRDYFGDKDKIVVMDDGKGMYLWDWFIPLAPCAHKERVGTIGDGGKWVCDMARYEKMPAVSGAERAAAAAARRASRHRRALAAPSSPRSRGRASSTRLACATTRRLRRRCTSARTATFSPLT